MIAQTLLVSPQADSKARPVSILVVDDDALSRDLICHHLKRPARQIIQAGDGITAMEQLVARSIDLIMLDMRMPRLDGLGVLNAVKHNPAYRDIPVIMITALDDAAAAVHCIESGAEDYLHKPVDPTLLRARVETCLEKKRLHDLECDYHKAILRQNEQLEERVAAQVGQISEAQLAVIFAMSRLAESKDPETGAHLERMREYCRVLSIELGRLPEYAEVITAQFVRDIYAASPLHDIGKVGIPDHILLKPGKLTEADWPIMRTHTTLGGRTLRAVDELYPGNAFIRVGIQVAESHHEKWDGSGYPFGLVGEAIPLAARILALGDVYDALTSQRCYKSAFTHSVSREILLEQRGRHFDPAVVDAFLRCEAEFIAIRAQHQDPEG